MLSLSTSFHQASQSRYNCYRSTALAALQTLVCFGCFDKWMVLVEIIDYLGLIQVSRRCYWQASRSAAADRNPTI